LDGFEVVKTSNLKFAIVEALTSLGGSGTISEVSEYLNSKYLNKWKLNTIGKIMADLCPESTYSFYPKKDRVLARIGRGKYRLRKAVAFPISRTFQTRKIRDYTESLGLGVFSFRGAEEILHGKGQLSFILKAASSTSLSSKEDHNQLQYFFHKNRWDVEVSLFPAVSYRIDAFKAKTGVEIERSLIDAVHRSLFRCQWSYFKGKLDVLVFIVPKNEEPKFEHVKWDLQEFKDIIPYPIYLIGIEAF
jgi:hypothetical protein